MKRKMISILLVGMMTMGLLAGCGNNTSTSGSTEGKESSAAVSSESQKESKEETKTEEKTDAGAEETVTVTWCIPGDKPEDYDMVMEDVNQKLKEKIGVELNLEIISQGEFNDKMQLKSSAGEDYDLVFTSNWLNKFNDNMSKEAFLPIGSIVDEYGKEMKEAIPDWLLNVGKVNGELYAIPNQQMVARQVGVVVQKEYAEKYHLDMESMQSVRDLEPFMEEIVKNEPDMFVIDVRLRPLLEQKYENLVSGYIYADKETGELYTLAEVMDDEMKLDHEWYEKGFIRQDVATVTDNSADVKANRYVISMGTYKPGWDAEYSNRQGVEYISIPVEGAFVGATSGSETMTAVNVNSKHPEEAIKLLNLVYTDKEIFNELLFGIEGVHYNVVSENHVEVVPDSKWALSGYSWKLGNVFNAWYVPGQADGLWEATDKLNREAQKSVYRGFTFDNANVQAELAQLSAVEAEYKDGQYITKDLDSWMKEYKEKLAQAGIDTLKAEVSSQIEAWKAAN